MSHLTNAQPFSCVIIGESTLPLQCAEILLARGHAICALISPDPRLARWAAERGIPHAAAPAELAALLGAQPFDYLFSIVNYQVLPAALLAAPRRWAINYHDAPLPRYAGSYATSWALIEQAASYAISWHLMTEQLDGGAILRQQPVELAPDETALTLNAKCYDAALRAFTALADDLARNRVTPQPQQLAARSFFARRRRPPAGAALRWDQPADQLAALVRALQFGPYPNPLALPRLALGDTFYTVGAATPLPGWPLPPGTLVSLAPEALTVATADGALALRDLRTIDGQPIAPTELAERHELRAGACLPRLEPKRAARLSELAERFGRHEPFWVAQLAQYQPASLPYTRRAAAGTPARSALPQPLPAELLAALGGPPEARADRLLATFVLYLARLNSSASFSLGYADHTLAEQIGDLAGCFATTVPLHVAPDLSGDFATLAGALAEQLAEIRRCGSFARDLAARTPALNELPELRDGTPWPLVVELVAPGSRFSAGQPSPQSAARAGELTLQIAADGSALCWVYDPASLPAAEVARMAEQLLTLLGGIAANPGQPAAELPLLPERERAQLAAWNRTAADFPQQRCIHELFAAQAARTPAALAVAHGRELLSYRQLDRRANQLARHLQAQGVGRETLVGIYLERSLDLVVGLLAILKAGGAYVPIDPAYPAERIAIMLEDSHAAVLLTEPRLAGRLVGSGARTVCLDDALRAELARLPAEPPASPADSQSLAYVLFTSGSTGRPKGVAIEHRSVAALISWARPLYSDADLAGVLFSTSICFDLSVFELFVPLSYGGAAILVENALALPGLVCDQPVTLLNTVPSVIAELARAGGVPASVRTINLAGEPLPAALVQQVYQHTSAERVFDLYGPSEDTTYSTCALRRPDAPATIGRPIANTCVYLLDPRRQPVPIGVPGEIYLSGAGLARGYLGRPDLTAERFVDNPFASAGAPASARMYRTGDLARFRADGSLEFIGRIDSQVKIRGFRIELGEIEAGLRRHPAVREAAVLARADGASKRLVAYVVAAQAQPGGALGAQALGDFLRQSLPEYMVPVAFVFLDTLPLTPNGKVDRRALPAPDQRIEAERASYAAPRDHVEQLLAEIWAQVLGLARVGIHDNFFALGGDSIIAMQVIARAAQVGLRLSPRQLFQHQTIAELAPVAGSTPAALADQAPVVGGAPLTPIQRWFFEHELPARDHWNQAMLLELARPIEPAALARALSQLIEHHDALRLRFSQRDGAWQQAHVPLGEPAALSQIDLAPLPAEARPAALASAMAELQGSLNIASGPLLRAALIEPGDGQPSQLLIAIHHLVVDGVSWRILLDDLQALLAGGRLPPKTSSFQQWAGGLERLAQSGRLRPEADAWLAAPRPAQPRIPLDFAPYAGANREQAARAVTQTLSADETQTLLHELPGAYQAQINDLLLTALAQAYQSWAGPGPLLVDLEGHGREELWQGLDLSRTVGWFTAIFPLALTIEPGAQLSAALKQVREQLAHIPRRGVGYGLLRYLSGDGELAERLRAQPQAQISFNYLGQFDNVLPAGAPLRLLRQPCGPLHAPHGERFHLLEITGSVVGGQLAFEWVYSENLHRHETIEALAAAFMGALRKLIAGRASPHAGGYTPADFPLAQLDRPTLDRLAAQEHAIDDIYPLAPGQRAMLAHALASDSPEVYHLQWRCTLSGQLDPDAFEQAWQRVTERHAVLRASFAWRDLPEPLQLVRRHAPAEWQRHDLRGLAPAEQQRRLDELLAAERQRGFDLAAAPLQRILLAQLDERRHAFCWSYHHLLLDGWSVAPLLREVLAIYDVLRQPTGTSAPVAYPGYERRRRKTAPLGQGLQLAPERPFRDYVAWCRRQDPAAAARFWRGYLASAYPLRLSAPPASGAGYGAQQRQLSPADTGALRELAQRSQVTLNTLVQAAYALVLSQHAERDEVIFGVTIACRPAALPDAAAVVGPLINTLPLRVGLPAGVRLQPWLRQIHAGQAELLQFDYTPLDQALAAAGHNPAAPLFDCILRFQNYPLDTSLWRRDSLELREASWYDHWHYPLCLVAEPGAALTLGATYDRARLSDAAAEQLLEQLQRVLERFSIATDPLLEELLETVQMLVRA